MREPLRKPMLFDHSWELLIRLTEFAICHFVKQNKSRGLTSNRIVKQIFVDLIDQNDEPVKSCL